MKSTWACTIILCVFLGLTSMNCTRPSRATLRDSLLLSTGNLKVYYNLNEPQAKYFLPYYLAEISGLSFKTPGSLLAIQDEQGVVYEFDLATEKVINSINFESRHDFEGIELMGDSVFTLESDGDIRVFSLRDPDPENVKVRTFDTDLSAMNDAEGLCYDPKSHSLLVACKSSGELNKNKVDGKAVYRFDLAQMKLENNPFFNVTSKDFERYFEREKKHDYKSERFRFEPSAIAFNPVDELYYLMASVGKLIVVFDEHGVIRGTYPIPASLLVQPEGLCFSPTGDMYISSEGDGDKGYIIKYTMNRR